MGLTTRNHDLIVDKRTHDLIVGLTARTHNLVVGLRIAPPANITNGTNGTNGTNITNGTSYGYGLSSDKVLIRGFFQSQFTPKPVNLIYNKE